MQIPSSQSWAHLTGQQLATTTASASASAAPIIQSHPLHKIRQGSSAAPSARLWNPVNHSPHSFEAAYQVQYSIAADDGASSAGAWDIDQQSLRYLQEYRRRHRRSLCSSAAPASADGGASDEAPLVSGGGQNSNNSKPSTSNNNNRSRAAAAHYGGSGIEKTASTMRHPWGDAAPHEKSRGDGAAARPPAASAEAAGRSGSGAGAGGGQSLAPYQAAPAAVAAGGTDFQGSKFVTDDPERGIRFNAQVAVRSALPPTLHLSRSQSSMRRNNSNPDAGDGAANRGGSSAVGAGAIGGGGEGTAAVAAGGGGGEGGGEAGAGGGAGGGDADETAWGPLHPCFPHPNPHVPLASPLHGATKIIRIRRDWMLAGDLAPTFSNVYPEVLDPVLPEEQFRRVIERLNRELVAIFSPRSARNWADVVLGALTLWLWDDLGLSAVKRRLGALEAWLEEWNEQTGAKEGVRIIPLRRTAYLTLDIQIPDPHLDLDVPEVAQPSSAAAATDNNPAAQAFALAAPPAVVAAGAATSAGAGAALNTRPEAPQPSLYTRHPSPGPQLNSVLGAPSPGGASDQLTLPIMTS